MNHKEAIDSAFRINRFLIMGWLKRNGYRDISIIYEGSDCAQIPAIRAEWHKKELENSILTNNMYIFIPKPVRGRVAEEYTLEKRDGSIAEVLYWFTVTLADYHHEGWRLNHHLGSVTFNLEEDTCLWTHTITL